MNKKNVAQAILSAILPLAAAFSSGDVLSAGQSGTTLAATKTLDICAVPATGNWRYSGVVSIWNQGAIDTVGLTIDDWIQNKVSGPNFLDVYHALYATGTVIPAGTTQLTALTFPYSYDGAPLSGTIRNIARVKILNHSGSLNTPTGPEPKFTFVGDVQPCPMSGGCVYTQGYWGNKPDVAWPLPYSRSAPFFNSGLTWQQILDTPAGGNGYFILGVQYIAAVLNQASGAAVPAGIQSVLSDAQSFFSGTSTPDVACPAANSCGTQKTWGGTLDSYNNGVYPGGPSHCE
ncbi:exported hypothetical protein [Cupriavidus taiwanensis]|uniref:Uncharacterized protein n=1 Tax=Cupriavidus taiwanensis TaxID=164546 RepID=A0A375C6R8_9BURK|nr:hypothetical protein [Cupriavidus taiwanensis]SOY63911.1 exported hypothetical protein [Cupriavidus taiwanensis]